MTVKEMASVIQTGIKIKDGGNGKVLCYRYKADKHAYLDDREVLSGWAEIRVSNSGYSSFASPVICVYVEHKEGEQK
jgi:hypothetical protein